MTFPCHNNIIQVYHPGETISGAVEFTLTEPKHYNCIKVAFLGSGHVEWYIWKEAHIGNEKYVENSLLLWSPQQNSFGSIGPGSYSFQFQFVIPSHVPSSFDFQSPNTLDAAKAYISYEIEASVITGAMQFNHKVSVPIVITPLVNIGIRSTPVQHVKRKQVGYLFCASGDVEFVAKLPRTGYCVTNGDVIPLAVNVQNNSTRMIKMKARIFRQVSMFARGHKRVSRKSVAEISSEPIQPGIPYIWNPTNWIVPALTPTLQGSRIIHVNYILEVSAVIPKAFNLSCDISLLMGNLPFDNENPEHALLGAIAQRKHSAASTCCGDVDRGDYEDEYSSSEQHKLLNN